MKRKFDRLSDIFYRYKKKHPKRVMTLLVLIIVPLAAGLILGYEMSGNTAMSIPTVIVNHDDSDFSHSFVSYISESEYFNVVEQADRDGRVEEMLYSGEAYVGVVIPEGLYSDMREGKAPQVLTVYDGSNMSVMTTAKSAMTEILITLKTAYMMNVYEGKLGVVPADVMNHAIPVDVTYRMLFNPDRNFRNFLLPGMLAALIQVGISCMGADRAWETQGKKLPFTAHLKVVILWGALGAVSIFLVMLEQYLFFGLPYRGTLIGGIVFTLLFSSVILMIGYIIGSVIADRTFATQVSAILVLPTTILGGYTWPVLAMPVFFQKLAVVIPFTYYGNAVRDLCLKPLEFHHLLPDIAIMCAFAAVELGILFLIRRREVAS
ncbi:MAG TPA: ABC transporter permease [Anaerovoracaceae bacterium]|nr:ABC transporter permease [Anaerovoracaceae bacterium]